MTDSVQALRSLFDAEREPHTPIGQHHLRDANAAIKNASAQITLLQHTDDFTEAHAKTLAVAAAQLHGAARKLEVLAAGVEDHVRNGVSTWRGAAGREEPVLL
jgi:hypothetical protein